MRIKRLANLFPVLDTSGYRNIRKSIAATVVQQSAAILSFCGSVLPIYIILKRPEIAAEKVFWLPAVFGLGILLMFLEIFLTRKKYKTTNLPAYWETERIRMDLARKLSELPMSYYNEKKLSDITGAFIDDCANVEHMIADFIPDMYASAITIPLSFLVLAVVDWRLMGAAVISVPLAFGFQMFSMKLIGELVDIQKNKKAKTASELQEYIDGMEQIRANSQIGEQYKELMESLRDLHRSSLKMELTAGVFTAGAESVLQLGIGLVIFSAARYLIGGTVDAFTVIFFLAAVLRLYIPIAARLGGIPSLLYMKKNVERIVDILTEVPMNGSGKPDIKRFTIGFQDVSFGYHHKNVVNYLNFTAEQGEVTAIVGPTGAGKSTIANLIARFWDTADGVITLDGHDIRTLDPEYYTRFVSFVFQDVILFQDTIYNNIRIGRPDAEEAEVMRAAAAAQCEEFVHRLPEGYQTKLVENGKTLSGGERQRIAIARAILKNTPIILLDEATASLDTMNEYYIHRALAELTKGKTVVIIAHTLRNISNADKIVVLKDGRIEEQGKHEDLIRHCGIYAHMYEIQKKSYEFAI